MNIFKKYINYLKDNPEGYWFKRKLYGWGWTPVKWQGWAVIIAYILSIIPFSLMVEGETDFIKIIFNFILPVVILTLILIGICYKKGERPRWQWGIKKDV